MLKRNKLQGMVFGVIILILFFIPGFSLAGIGPWQIRTNEKKVEGILLYVDSGNVTIRSTGQKDNCEYKYKLTPSTLSALMGSNSGLLISPDSFPPLTEVELYVNTAGMVRAMRNKQNSASQAAGELLDGWGHNACLSPDEQFYVIYNLHTGLHIYNIANPAPRYLSKYPLASWNQKNELAYVGDSNNEIIIENVVNNNKDSIVLDPIRPELSRIITTICWNKTGDMLYYTALEDYPNTDSEIFRLSVLDRNGKELARKIIPYLGDSLWLSNDLILYVDYDNPDELSGSLRVWNYETGKTSLFLPKMMMSYRSIAYHPELQLLAFTTVKDLYEKIYVLDISSGNITPLTTLIYPGRNLQWSKDGSLFYWDELNNNIVIIKDKGSLVDRFSGYLPPQCVQTGFLYFPTEPLEEPLQPFIAR